MYEEIIQQKLICITNRHLVQGDFLDRIRQIAAKKQVDAIILREKDLSEEDYRTLAEAVLENLRGGMRKHCILHNLLVRSAVTTAAPVSPLVVSCCFCSCMNSGWNSWQRECGQPTFWGKLACPRTQWKKQGWRKQWGLPM